MVEKILVIGATGLLGEPVARKLQADGYVVRILSRSLEKAKAKFGSDFEIAVGDVEDTNALETALRNCDGVHINLDGGQDPDLERRGVINTVEAAKKIGVKRITYLSGASVCEENRWFAGTNAKFQAETAIASSGLAYTIFKSTFFMESLPRFVQGKRASVIGKQPFSLHWVSATDYAEMVSKAYKSSEVVGKAIYVLGSETYTMENALKIYCAKLNPNAVVSNLPIMMARLIALMSNSKELKQALPFFSYTGKVKVLENGDSNAALSLLGRPFITLEEWCKTRSGELNASMKA
ncbi:NAD(P)H-binding protein [Candidatus Chlorohelix sp.]|uniref:SDR family oxidoreductase n=1 Tax=Candidatus Chlorohelix sp. TaxID=3139201 RepID=UPI00303B9205